MSRLICCECDNYFNSLDGYPLCPACSSLGFDENAEEESRKNVVNIKDYNSRRKGQDKNGK